MPLYDYTCNSCGTEWEEIRPIKERATYCGCGSAVSPNMSGGKFILYGSGWSGTSHHRVIPAKVEHAEPPPTNYYNCTPESVHN